MNRLTYKVTALANRHFYIRLTDQIAIITKASTRPGKNGKQSQIVSAYFGFSTQNEAIDFIGGLHIYFPNAFCQARLGQRLETAFEVKVRAFEGLENFTWLMTGHPAIATFDIFPARAEVTETAIDPNGHIFDQREREWHLDQNRVPLESERCPRCGNISLTREQSPESLLVDCWIEECNASWVLPR